MRKIAICSIVFTFTYFIFYFAAYNEKREVIKEDLNKLFKVYAPSIVDSILLKENIHIREYKDIERFKEKHDYILEDENGIITIPNKYIKEYDFTEFCKRETQTFLLHLGLFNLNIADIIWNNKLYSEGYNVESALFLSTKDLRTMFPQSGDIRTDIKAPIHSTKHLNEKKYFVTDSVGLGIQNQAYIFSEIHIPTFQIIKKAKWWGLELWIAICTSIIAWFYLSYRNSKGKCLPNVNSLSENKINETQIAKEESSIATIGDVTYNFHSKIISNRKTEEQIKLPGTQAITFELLIQADNYIVTKKEICCKLWNLNEKDGCNRYNALSFRLRESLSKISDIELQTIKDTALQLSFSKNIKEE